MSSRKGAMEKPLLNDNSDAKYQKMDGDSHGGGHGGGHGSPAPAAAASSSSSHAKSAHATTRDVTAEEALSEFDVNGLSSEEASRRLLQFGRNELKEVKTPCYALLLKYYWGTKIYKPNPITLLMWVAAIVSIASLDYADFAVIMALIIINGAIAWFENAKAGNAVAALKAALAPKAMVYRDRDWKPIDASILVPGDKVRMKLGDVVPADCILAKGGSMDLDQAGLTGESLPVTKFPGDLLYSGTTVKRGESDGFVKSTGELTEFGKTAALIQSVDEVGNFQKVLSRIAYFLIGLALVLVIVMLFVQLFAFQPAPPVLSVIKQALVLLVASVPIAMPVVCTATMAVGARRLADHKAVVTKLSAIEELAGMTILCSDKTGTLTKNILTLDDPWTVPGVTADDIIFAAALACKRVEPDAIDTAMLKFCPNKAFLDNFEQVEFVPFDPSNRKTEATVRNKQTGEIFKVTKGAPQVILEIAKNRDEIADECQAHIVDFAHRGLRSLGVARSRPEAPEDWYMMGILSLFDPPRDDTKAVIEKALTLGVSVKMITGDHLLIARETARRLGMGANILQAKALHEGDREQVAMVAQDVDGFAEVFPQDKFDIVAMLIGRGNVTGMTGDGVNDAPALKRANVGFAVEGATAAAQGAASVVLSLPGLSVIITAILRSRKIFQRMQNYAVYRINVSLQLLFFFFFGTVALNFRLPAIIVILIALLNDLTVMSIAYDKVFPAEKPDSWRVLMLVFRSSVLATIYVGGSVLMLYMVQQNFFAGSQTSINFFGSTGITVPQQHSALFLQISLCLQLSVFIARTESFVFTRRPGFVLLGAMLIEMIVATVLAFFWPGQAHSADPEALAPLPGPYVGIIWAYAFVLSVLVDIIKTIINKLIAAASKSKEQKLAEIRASVRRSMAHAPTVVGSADRRRSSVYHGVKH